MKPPLTLAIETSNPSSVEALELPALAHCPGVALVGVAGPLGVERVIQTAPGPGSARDDLMPAVDRLFRRLGLEARALTRVCVSVGPGGFTAVRLAVTSAKMISEVTGAACVGVPTALVVARRVQAHGRSFGVALASKGDTAFVTLFGDPGLDQSGVARGEGTLMDCAALRGAGISLLIADRFLPPAMRRACDELGIAVEPPHFDPIACAEAGEGLPHVDPALLLPLYPREPEAVTKWRALHGG